MKTTFIPRKLHFITYGNTGMTEMDNSNKQNFVDCESNSIVHITESNRFYNGVLHFRTGANMV